MGENTVQTNIWQNVCKNSLCWKEKKYVRKYYAAQRKPLSKNVQLCNILPTNYLSYIFEFQLVPIAFSLILGDPFMVKGGDFFLKNAFYVWTNFVTKIYRGIVIHGGTNDQSKGKGASQNVFSSYLNT